MCVNKLKWHHFIDYKVKLDLLRKNECKQYRVLYNITVTWASCYPIYCVPKIVPDNNQNGKMSSFVLFKMGSYSSGILWHCQITLYDHFLGSLSLTDQSQCLECSRVVWSKFSIEQSTKTFPDWKPRYQLVDRLPCVDYLFEWWGWCSP